MQSSTRDQANIEICRLQLLIAINVREFAIVVAEWKGAGSIDDEMRSERPTTLGPGLRDYGAGCRTLTAISGVQWDLRASVTGLRWHW
jgi:hypothetical protein